MGWKVNILGFTGQEDVVKSKIYTRSETNICQIYFSSDYTYCRTYCVQSDVWGS
jgi:hypothetical protein